MKFCAYHNQEHLESEFNNTQLKRKNSAWCRKALAENKRLKSKGLESNSKASGVGGRPKWYTPEQLEELKEMYFSWKYSNEEIARHFDKTSGSYIINIIKSEGWDRGSKPQIDKKICTECNQEKSIEEFTFRKDRPTQLHAKCKTCLKNVIRAYNKTAYNKEPIEERRDRQRRLREINPEIHRAAGRKRRARKASVRHESYNTYDIWKKENKICYVCGQSININLQWPDKMSITTEHIHPISKRGPDIYKNIAVSHLTCNSKKYNNFKSPFNLDWSVREIPFKEARIPIEANHYLHTSAARPTASFGLFYKNNLTGVAMFGACAGPTAALSICTDQSLVREFNRLWIDDTAPFGAASWFVSKALKLLNASKGPLLIITYADPTVGHTGDVYKSLSFMYAGPGSTGKLRFWTAIGSKSEKNKLKNIAKWPSLPYE